MEMGVTLATLVAPLGIGLIIFYCWPGLAHFLSAKMVKPCAFVILIIMGAV